MVGRTLREWVHNRSMGMAWAYRPWLACPPTAEVHEVSAAPPDVGGERGLVRVQHGWDLEWHLQT